MPRLLARAGAGGDDGHARRARLFRRPRDQRHFRGYYAEIARGEYGIPFPYQYRAGPDGAKDFFSRKGAALDESLAVRGWVVWKREGQ